MTRRAIASLVVMVGAALLLGAAWHDDVPREQICVRDHDDGVTRCSLENPLADTSPRGRWPLADGPITPMGLAMFGAQLATAGLALLALVLIWCDRAAFVRRALPWSFASLALVPAILPALVASELTWSVALLPCLACVAIGAGLSAAARTD